MALSCSSNHRTCPAAPSLPHTQHWRYLSRWKTHSTSHQQKQHSARCNCRSPASAVLSCLPCASEGDSAAQGRAPSCDEARKPTTLACSRFTRNKSAVASSSPLIFFLLLACMSSRSRPIYTNWCALVSRRCYATLYAYAPDTARCRRTMARRNLSCQCPLRLRFSQRPTETVKLWPTRVPGRGSCFPGECYAVPRGGARHGL